MSLSPEAQALFDQYANKGMTQEQPQYSADSNQRARVSEMLSRKGITDRESPEAYAAATRLALAAQARQLNPGEYGMGVNGRSGTGRAPERTGRSLADIAAAQNAPKE